MKREHTKPEGSKGRRKFLRNISLLSIGSIGLGSGLARAENISHSPIDTLPEEYRPGASGVAVLSPEPDSRQASADANIVLVLLIEEDDRVKTLVLGQGVEPLEYSVITNPEDMTYRISNFQYLESPREDTSPADTSSSPLEEKHTESSDDGNDMSTTSTSDYGPFTVQITTHDPVEVRLCRTKQTLEWAYNSNLLATYITDRKWTAVWWAPTAVGTHWYKDWAKFVDRYESNTKCYTECEAQYYNDDYGDDHKRTFSWHKLHITGYSSGAKDYWGTADHWGEGGGNLHTHEKVV